MRDLNALEKLLIKAALVDQPARPGRFSLGWFQGRVKIDKYTNEEVKNALDSMCRDGILNCDDDNIYFLGRTHFLELKREFRFYLRWTFLARKLGFFLKRLWSKIIIAVLIGVVVSILGALLLNLLNISNR